MDVNPKTALQEHFFHRRGLSDSGSAIRLSADWIRRDADLAMSVEGRVEASWLLAASGARACTPL